MFCHYLILLHLPHFSPPSDFFHYIIVYSLFAFFLLSPPLPYKISIKTAEVFRYPAGMFNRVSSCIFLLKKGRLHLMQFTFYSFKLKKQTLYLYYNRNLPGQQDLTYQIASLSFSGWNPESHGCRVPTARYVQNILNARLGK